MHGDNGRTNPSMGFYLPGISSVKVLSLDVLKVHLDWPPRYESNLLAAANSVENQENIAFEKSNIEKNKTQ